MEKVHGDAAGLDNVDDDYYDHDDGSFNEKFNV